MKTSIAIHAIAVTLFGAVMFAPANASAQVNIYIGPGGYSHYGYGYYGYPRYGYYPNYSYGYRYPYYGYGYGYYPRYSYGYRGEEDTSRIASTPGIFIPSKGRAN